MRQFSRNFNFLIVFLLLLPIPSPGGPWETGSPGGSIYFPLVINSALPAVQIAAGGFTTCAIINNGSVKCWGSGGLGDGTFEASSTPVSVAGLSGAAAAITIGDEHACLVTKGGGVKCWGNNFMGGLGEGTTTGHSTPVDVTGLTSGVLAVTAGYGHTCALNNAGGVLCWGNNQFGELGIGSHAANTLTPQMVAGLTSGVTAIAARGMHTCALVGAGVKCWGDITEGVPGDGTQTYRLTPVGVPGLSSGVAAIAVGWNHTCALTTGGGVKCWGDNWAGQLGDGTTIDRLTPVDVTGLTVGVIAISAGWDHTCAITKAGQVKCWGYNYFGALGEGSNANRTTPVDVVGLPGLASAIAAGNGHTCALISGGGVACWGDNQFGQVGDGITTTRPIPVTVIGLSTGASAVASGGNHTCALIVAGGVRCWGNNQYGQVGDGTDIDRWAPVDVKGLSSGAAAIAVGLFHTCVTTTDGGVKCWGPNGAGQLGDGSTSDHWTPVEVKGIYASVKAVTVGEGHSCALTVGGGVKCWGANQYGQLGDGTKASRPVPEDVVGLMSGVAAITSAGGSHTCALTTTGAVKCWGANQFGQLGDGSTHDQWTPVDVAGLSSGVVGIAAGFNHTCALTQEGGVKCWGSNDSGQLGDGTTSDRWTPVAVGGLPFGAAAVAAGGDHTCVLTTIGGVECWGNNKNGQLGVGGSFNHLTPSPVIGLLSGVTAITAGMEHTCALTSAGGVMCWGWNYSGQVGAGSNASYSSPVTVVGFP